MPVYLCNGCAKFWWEDPNPLKLGQKFIFPGWDMSAGAPQNRENRPLFEPFSIHFFLNFSVFPSNQPKFFESKTARPPPYAMGSRYIWYSFSRRIRADWVIPSSAAAFRVLPHRCMALVMASSYTTASSSFRGVCSGSYQRRGLFRS